MSVPGNGASHSEKPRVCFCGTVYRGDAGNPVCGWVREEPAGRDLTPSASVRESVHGILLRPHMCPLGDSRAGRGS